MAVRGPKFRTSPSTTIPVLALAAGVLVIVVVLVYALMSGNLRAHVVNSCPK